MRTATGMALTLAACAALTAGAQAPKPPAKLAAARAEYQKVAEAARATQEKATEAAKANFDKAVAPAADALRKQLTALLDEQTKSGNLDGALATREELKSLGEGGAVSVAARKVAAKADLRKALAGTKWDWPDGVLTFQADGLARQPVWESNRLVTKWDAVDRRLVLLVIDKGRENNRVAVLEFSESLDEFSGYNFGGVRMSAVKRRPPGK